MKDTKTFIANIRCDYRYIAKIAKFLASKGIFVGTTSKIASEAIRILAHGISDKFDCIEYREALKDLRVLGYREDLTNKIRYYKTLTNEIKVEEGQKTAQLSIEQETARLVKEYNKKRPASIDMSGREEILVSPKPEPEPKSESPQLKTRTADNERADISRLRTGLSGAPTQVLEENKTGKD